MKVVKKFTRQNVRLWLLVATVGAGITLFAYVAVQQSLRLGANDPQTQLAEETAAQLNQGASPSSVIPKTVIDESHDLSSFVTIVDSHIQVLASSGRVEDHTPLPPASSFPDSQKRSSNWFTWKHDGIRDAAVIVPFKQGSQHGYVLAARSMSQVENTISHITTLALFTLLGVLVAPAIILLLV